MATAGGTPSIDCASAHSESARDSAMEHTLQEITAVGLRKERLDSNISALAAETKSIRLDIVSFQNRVTDSEQRITTVEGCLNVMPDGDQELLFLHSKCLNRGDACHWDGFLFAFKKKISQFKKFEEVTPGQSKDLLQVGKGVELTITGQMTENSKRFCACLAVIAS
ncbi:hypothetical protein NDU88_002067 [Pleurodeles waltl]|uniref:Uncharacterized protein n=1 Tax=Pleurodeles waltl TaxID=8319 RepID=A0AAV7UWH5_PLEWA|nr:hypothetical protein NDU88_002067 [Pleurodeles waltl]